MTSLIPQPRVVDSVSSIPRHHLELFLDVADDRHTISAYRVPIALRGLNPNTLKTDALELVATYPSHGLLYPDVYIGRNLPADTASQLFGLYGLNHRVTRYQGVSVDWDSCTDKGVWTTNIDTVVLIDELRKLGIFEDADIKKVVEVGVGGGHISAMLAHKMPWLSALHFTDIIPEALMCTLRNLRYVAGADLMLQPYLGKGIQDLQDEAYDLMVVNPPYIPVAPHIQTDSGDPYRGTGLIHEIVKMGLQKSKRVILAVSSTTLVDIKKYADESGMTLVFRSESQPVPLKIAALDYAWKQWLVQQGGLEERDPEVHSYRYWHKLHTVEILKF